MFPGFIPISKLDHTSNIYKCQLLKKPLKSTIFALISKKSGFMRNTVIFSRIFPQFTFRYWLSKFFPLFIRYVGTLFMFIVSCNNFGSEIAKGKFSKKLQFF